MKEKLKYLLTAIILQASTASYACKCTAHSLFEDISDSDEIFIGTVVSNAGLNNWNFIFEVKKVYMGSLTPNKNYEIIQGTTSCNKTRFTYGETYLIFSSNKSVSQCNNSGRFENNRNITLLDSVFHGKHLSTTATINELKEIQERYNNFLLLSNMDAIQSRVLGLKDKKVAFWDGKRCFARTDIQESDNYFYLTRYYLEAEAAGSEWLKALGADYLILVTHSHQARSTKIGWMNNEKPTKKLVKSIKAFLNI